MILIILSSFSLSILSTRGSVNTLIFDYRINFSDCLTPSGELYGLNVSSYGQTIIFSQKYYLNCQIRTGNLRLNLTESGENLTITEKYDDGPLANCNCWVYILGEISSLENKSYKLIFNLEIVDDNISRIILMDTIQIEIGRTATTSNPSTPSAQSTSSAPQTTTSSSARSEISTFPTFYPFITCLLLLTFKTQYRKKKKIDFDLTTPTQDCKK